ncbi:hypothetical protein IEQ34_001717 [Dendrobium chrysotoxum]|uniref:Transmembrane protein n=1 Tax=Dendrobium chrysotoxum TaxID=161865 RepID=A0AAV7H8P8_DENCH|nr:hypothetical protein IEQ34_001717 [Dendrobium chrysotoxum]
MAWSFSKIALVLAFVLSILVMSNAGRELKSKPEVLHPQNFFGFGGVFVPGFTLPLGPGIGLVPGFGGLPIPAGEEKGVHQKHGGEP